MRWLDCITASMNISELQEIVKDRKTWSAAVRGVTNRYDSVTEQQNFKRSWRFGFIVQSTIIGLLLLHECLSLWLHDVLTLNNQSNFPLLSSSSVLSFWHHKQALLELLYVFVFCIRWWISGVQKNVASISLIFVALTLFNIALWSNRLSVFSRTYLIA